jgi:hypothetical protein
MIVHNVFFKLKDNSQSMVDALVAACHQYLTVQPGISYFAAGKLCAELNREVNDLNWDVGLTLSFDTLAAHDAYQIDATHNLFIEEQKANWASVRVFDTQTK